MSLSTSLSLAATDYRVIAHMIFANVIIWAQIKVTKILSEWNDRSNNNSFVSEWDGTHFKRTDCVRMSNFSATHSLGTLTAVVHTKCSALCTPMFMKAIQSDISHLKLEQQNTFRVCCLGSHLITPLKNVYIKIEDLMISKSGFSYWHPKEGLNQWFPTCRLVYPEAQISKTQLIMLASFLGKY